MAPGVTSAAIRVEDRSAALYPEEARIVASAAPRRARTFSSGRAAARAALAAAGCPEADRPILAEGRRPLAPEGWRLSISHTDEIAVAVACPAAAAEGVGVDIERIDRMDPALRRFIVHETDRLPEPAGVHELTLAFSLRESLFKALDPEAQRSLRRIDLDWTRPGVGVSLVPPGLGDRLRHVTADAAGHVLCLCIRG